MKNTLYLLPVMFCCFHTQTAGNDGTAGDVHLANGQQTVTALNTFALINNPGAAGFLDHPSAALDLSTSYWPLPVRTCTAATVFPLAHGAAGMTWKYSGTSYYHHTEMSLAYAGRLHHALGIGLAFSYSCSKASGYRSGQLLTASVGMLCRLSERTEMGIRVESPLHLVISGNHKANPPSSFTMGIGFRPVPQLELSIEGQQQPDHPLNLKAGIQFRGMNKMGISLHYSVRPSILSAGTNLLLHRNCSLLIASSYQPALGFRASASVYIQWRNNVIDRSGGKRS